MASERMTTEKTIKEAWAKASPGEKSQIIAFVVSATEPPPTGHCHTPGGKFFLIRMRHHDTGKPILTVGTGLEKSEGLPPGLFRPLIGLPALPSKPVAVKPAPAKLDESSRERKKVLGGKSLLNKGAKN